MIRHLFKLIWNRKRENALVVLEIFVCFLVLFAVTTLALHSWTTYRDPIGFEYDNVFAIDIGFPEIRGDGNTPATPVVENPYEARHRALLDIVKADPSVENAAWASPIPFSQSNESRSANVEGRQLRYSIGQCTDEYKDVMGIEITRGRWFGPEDQGAPYDAYVVTEELARSYYGDADPIGKDLNGDSTGGDSDAERARRIVGVMRAFRQEGELDTDRIYALMRLSYSSASMRRVGSMTLKVKPGADATVEARLAKSLEAAAPDWSFKVTPLALGAEFNRRIYMVPIALALTVASFLVLMVALGLSGILWQSVTTRIREIGVRRALGASASDVRQQVTGELLVMATVAMIAGVLVVLQFPFLDLLGNVPQATFFAGLGLTIVTLYALALVCAAQPARLATTIHPAEALRYE